MESFHTFSFAGYQDPEFTAFRTLRALNEDRVRPGAGFPTHSHRNMEIVTWVLEGAVKHEDSLGNAFVIRPGEAQRMSAGTGVTHSEYNASSSTEVHFFQIWILPAREGCQPGYEQKSFSLRERSGRLCLIVSPDGRDGALTIQQDVDLFTALLSPGEQFEHVPRPGRHLWLQVGRGAVRCGDLNLEEGDGAALSDETSLRAMATQSAEVLLFDLP
jgi:redox-sensitive bicupin YhaK (pirin superfamily)